MELELLPGSTRFEADDERWTAHELQLLNELRREVGDVRRDRTPAAGEKGIAETIIVALASAGTFGVLLECVTTWLTRDRTRTIEFTVGEEKHTLRGTELDDETIDRFKEAVLKRLEQRT